MGIYVRQPAACDGQGVLFRKAYFGVLPEVIQAHPAIVANGLTGNFGKSQIGEVIVSM